MWKVDRHVIVVTTSLTDAIKSCQNIEAVVCHLVAARFKALQNYLTVKL